MWVTRTAGNRAWIKADSIAMVERRFDGGATITMAGVRVDVEESFEEIRDLMMKEEAQSLAADI